MQTSYFARYKGDKGVSISLGTPKWFKGEKYTKLNPTWAIINEYKKDKDEDKYIKSYYKEVLSKLDPKEVYEELKDKTILCYEKTGDFCHRRLVADWLSKELNVFIPELHSDFKLIELFGGIGAMSSAADRLNILKEIVDYVEIDKYACASYNSIHDTMFETQSVVGWDKEVNEVDLIMGGFPCQDISSAGKQAGVIRGETRSGLMYDMLDIVEKVKPKYVIAENVKNLLSYRHKDKLDEYIRIIERSGYDTYYDILNSSDFGVPQNRDRVFIVSIRKDIMKEFEFPKPLDIEKVTLDSILEDEVPESYFIDDDKTVFFVEGLRGHKSKEVGYMARKNGIGKRHQSNVVYSTDATIGTLVACDYKNPPKIMVLGLLDIKGIEQVRRIYSPNGLSPTLTTMQGGGKVPKIMKNFTFKHRMKQLNNSSPFVPNSIGIKNKVDNKKLHTRIRKLTPRECWRLQGFTDEEFDKAQAIGTSKTQLYKQAGNSITVNVLVELLKKLL